MKIANGVQLSVSDGSFLYANEAIVNEVTLTLNSGKFVVAKNFIIVSGTFSAANDTLEVVGVATRCFTFGSNNNVKRVELSKSANTATVAAVKLIITASFKSVVGTLDADDKIILQSNSTKTAVVEQSASGTVKNIVMERCIPAKHAFRLLSTLVTSSSSIKYHWQENQNNTSPLFANNLKSASGYGTHIARSTSVVNVFDATQSGNAFLFLFNNTNQSWGVISNTDTKMLLAGGAYRLIVRGDCSIDMNTNTPSPTAITLRCRGTLKIGSHSVTSLNATADAYNIIGNPYQIPVDIAAVLKASTNIKTTCYYDWDPKVAGTNGSTTFVTYTFLNNSNSVSRSLVNQYLQPMQACFVNTLINGPCSVLFQEGIKFTFTNENVYRKATSLLTSLQLNLFDSTSYSQGAAALDVVMCFFGSTYSKGLDEYDAGKLINLDENLALMVENRPQSISTYAEPTPTTIYPLNHGNYRYQNYVIKTGLVNYDELAPYLADQFLGIITALDYNSNYAFSIDPNQAESSATDRFKIVFQKSTLSAADFSKKIAIFPNPAKAEESFYLQGISEIASVTLYTVLGQKVPVEIQAQAQHLKVTPKTNVSHRIYLVNITAEDQSKSIKWIVE